ncbi:MAG TPA: hypothetical protein H9837_04190 [Candidatus Brachybacterium merdigallinarum]|nr:hypothetical protein [Candidatus Brachybacterium merdigallinarum]
MSPSTRHPAPRHLRSQPGTPSSGISRREGRHGAGLCGAEGSMTILTTGVLVVILMVIAVGASITGVHLERSGLQHAADSAALAGAQAVDPTALYRDGDRGAIGAGSAEDAAAEHLATYPFETGRTENIRITGVEVDADGTVHITLSAHTHPPLVGWFLRGTDTAVPLTVTGEARAR